MYFTACHWKENGFKKSVNSLISYFGHILNTAVSTAKLSYSAVIFRNNPISVKSNGLFYRSYFRVFISCFCSWRCSSLNIPIFLQMLTLSTIRNWFFRFSQLGTRSGLFVARCNFIHINWLAIVGFSFFILTSVCFLSGVIFLD